MSAWVDANVLLRFLTKTPTELAERAKALLQRGERGDLTLWVHPLVVAETVWVLQSYYAYPKARIVAEVAGLLETRALKVVEGKVVTAALYGMAERNVDFVDAFLAVVAQSRDDQVASFDRDFDKLGVRRLEG